MTSPIPVYIAESFFKNLLENTTITLLPNAHLGNCQASFAFICFPYQKEFLRISSFFDFEAWKRRGEKGWLRLEGEMLEASSSIEKWFASVSGEWKKTLTGSESPYRSHTITATTVFL